MFTAKSIPALLAPRPSHTVRKDSTFLSPTPVWESPQLLKIHGLLNPSAHLFRSQQRSGRGLQMRSIMTGAREVTPLSLSGNGTFCHRNQDIFYWKQKYSSSEKKKYSFTRKILLKKHFGRALRTFALSETNTLTLNSWGSIVIKKSPRVIFKRDESWECWCFKVNLRQWKVLDYNDGQFWD